MQNFSCCTCRPGVTSHSRGWCHLNLLSARGDPRDQPSAPERPDHGQCEQAARPPGQIPRFQRAEALHKRLTVPCSKPPSPAALLTSRLRNLPQDFALGLNSDLKNPLQQRKTPRARSEEPSPAGDRAPLRTRITLSLSHVLSSDGIWVSLVTGLFRTPLPGRSFIHLPSPGILCCSAEFKSCGEDLMVHHITVFAPVKFNPLSKGNGLRKKDAKRSLAHCAREQVVVGVQSTTGIPPGPEMDLDFPRLS